MTDVESGYNFSLLFDVENLPEDKGNDIIHSFPVVHSNQY